MMPQAVRPDVVLLERRFEGLAHDARGGGTAQSQTASTLPRLALLSSGIHAQCGCDIHVVADVNCEQDAKRASAFRLLHVV